MVRPEAFPLPAGAMQPGAVPITPPIPRTRCPEDPDAGSRLKRTWTS